jgi:gamma-glutamylcyclotransferase (GGCT)/AIG2-like uncharacterized protein YtfP
MRRKKYPKEKPNVIPGTRKYYLAYGMNTNIASMKNRCPQAQSLGLVNVPDHALVFRTHCDVIPELGSTLQCVLWSITDQCEDSLDLLEGYPSYYNKKELTVQFQGRRVRAMIYYMQDREYQRMPSAAYFDMVRVGYQEHGLSTSALEKALLQAYNYETRLENLSIS